MGDLFGIAITVTAWRMFISIIRAGYCGGCRLKLLSPLHYGSIVAHALGARLECREPPVMAVIHRIGLLEAEFNRICTLL